MMYQDEKKKLYDKLKKIVDGDNLDPSCEMKEEDYDVPHKEMHGSSDGRDMENGDMDNMDPKMKAKKALLGELKSMAIKAMGKGMLDKGAESEDKAKGIEVISGKATVMVPKKEAAEGEDKGELRSLLDQKTELKAKLEAIEEKIKELTGEEDSEDELFSDEE